jgi:membrane protease YdiL (CAAX protease family)
MATITNLFWNTEEARLRAGWRVVVFLIASFVVGEALLGLRPILARLLPVIYSSAVEAAVYLLLIGVILLLASRILDHRRIIDYGFHLSGGWWIDLGFGLALGTLLLLGILVLELAMGWIKVTGTFAPAPGQPFGATILVGFIAVLSIAVGEEVTWRGYPIKNLAEGLNWRVIGPRWATVIAVLIPALLFGLAHATNPNATTLSTINIMIFAVLFAAGYVLTGELALPIGLHFAWDFIQGFVFGVTGSTSQLGSFLVLAEDDPAGKLWTGLPYGAEGGPLATGAFILGFFLTAAWVRLRRGSVRLDPSLAQPPRQPAAV